VGDSNKHCCPVGWKKCDNDGCVPDCEGTCAGANSGSYDRYCPAKEECVNGCGLDCGLTANCTGIASQDNICVSSCNATTCPGKPNGPDFSNACH